MQVNGTTGTENAKPFLCSTCGSDSFVAHAYRGRGRDEVFRRCKPCSRKATEAWKRGDSQLAAKYRLRQNAHRRTTAKARRVALRESVLNLYGNRCGYCGTDDPVVLDLDHVTGGGNKDRKTSWAYSAYSKALKNKEDFQILCRNCNWKKFRTGHVPTIALAEGAKSF